MGKRISNSQIDMFKLCGRKWDLRYNERLIPQKYYSALMFGIAIDEALGLLCLLKMKNPTDKQKVKIKKLKADREYPHRLFMNKLGLQRPFEKLMDEGGNEIKQIDVRKDYRCEYYGSDFSAELLDDTDKKILKKYMKTAGYEEKDPIVLWNALNDDIKDKRKLDLVGKEFYNYCCFLSLLKKGRIMIDLFREEVLPQIKEVHSLQEYVKLENEQGDTLIGYIDVMGILEGEDVVRVIDIKTSSKKYALDSVEESQQLGIYTEYKNTDLGAYIVLIKKPKVTEIYKCFNDDCTNGEEFKGKRRKKCPECKEPLFLDRVDREYEHQIVKGEINSEKKDLLFDDISGILKQMENEEYDENRDSCFAFGKKCEYFNVCRNDDMEGLLCKGKRK